LRSPPPRRDPNATRDALRTEGAPFVRMCATRAAMSGLLSDACELVRASDRAAIIWLALAERGKRWSVEGWPGGISAITLFVEDLDAAKRFYGEVFGLPVAFADANSAVFDFGNSIINLLRTEAADELVAPATVASAAHGSGVQLTIQVDDVDALCAELVGRGVDLLNGPMDRPWGIRTASFRDPAGHIWEIAK
jgi:catechol 2,3-dioxygenase-like lactoylglutathione lyase family enzyme